MSPGGQLRLSPDRCPRTPPPGRFSLLANAACACTLRRSPVGCRESPAGCGVDSSLAVSRRHDTDTRPAEHPAVGQAPPPWVPIASRLGLGTARIAGLSWAGVSEPLMTVGVTKEPQRSKALTVAVTASPQRSRLSRSTPSMKVGLCLTLAERGLGVPGTVYLSSGDSLLNLFRPRQTARSSG